MKRLIFCALLLFAPGAFAGEVVIPVAYRGGGAAGTQWRTDIAVANASVAPLLVPVMTTITFHQDNGETHVVRFPLSRFEGMSVPDAVKNWFDVDQGGGIVRVTWDEQDAKIIAHARIYNVTEQGEYGQTVPGVATWKLETEHFLPGLTGIHGNRTNVGIANPSATANLVWITLMDTSGLERGSFAVFVAPRSFRQFNDIFSYFQAGPLHAAMVRVSAVYAPVYAYASVVRNDTGDATFIAQY